MGQKINPILYRIGVNKETDSIWYAQGSSYVDSLQEDIKIRSYIHKRLEDKMVSKVKIYRKTNSIAIDIHTARPGLVIGKKGEDIDKLRGELNILINKNRSTPIAVSINIEQIDKMWLDARLVGKEIARQLEERVSFRRAMKMAMRNVMRDNALGVKVQVSGRLGGAEIARTERYKQGRTPLHTLRADIDYAHVEASTTYGVIGIKVWIYKGDILN
ncbi:MAG: 30S ribosomal protein S3 [Candidatus Cloacimonadaceae bacterium]|nr:30S ribosomal protein S3 [Candidatus Cloacimonadota bacterium]MDY0127492.1 30S ribosomal protein S3 [Candidatus Cloacimonadaceae bacterium]MCB5254694.1 30S ribosomal protein S3 [Candidatus Cloacimonadota bacterium]MCK9177949.1 30S ribosomal protein S3 [Candidatus Cloacimonadota bacterium]MCK9243396.1 30S ribosomal protein S3 [Candidatus Cloacimonadota bacterium]